MLAKWNLKHAWFSPKRFYLLVPPSPDSLLTLVISTSDGNHLMLSFLLLYSGYFCLKSSLGFNCWEKLLRSFTFSLRTLPVPISLKHAPSSLLRLWGILKSIPTLSTFTIASAYGAVFISCCDSLKGRPSSFFLMSMALSSVPYIKNTSWMSSITHLCLWPFTFQDSLTSYSWYTVFTSTEQYLYNYILAFTENQR